MSQKIVFHLRKGLLIFCVIFTLSILLTMVSPHYKAQAFTYPFTKSHYIFNGSYNSMYSLGYNQANQEGLVILFFGCPEKVNNKYGSKLYGSGGFYTTSQIKDSVEAFMDGYNENNSHTEDIIIAVGTLF